MTPDEIAVLEMCRAFARHLLGQKFFDDAGIGLQKSRGMLPAESAASADADLEFLSAGHIDYTPYQGMIRELMRAFSQKKVCKISYQSVHADAPRTYYINPFKIFAHKDTIYIHCWRYTRLRDPEASGDEFFPVLALQRFRRVEVLDTKYKLPADYDFEEIFTRSFGVVKEKAFKVEIEFTGWCAQYVAERIWSPDQKIVKKRDGGIRLIFQASSDVEVLGWALSFGEKACIVKPAWLKKKMIDKLRIMADNYK